MDSRGDIMKGSVVKLVNSGGGGGGGHNEGVSSG